MRAVLYLVEEKVDSIVMETRSHLTGRFNRMSFPMGIDEFTHKYIAWIHGAYIQEVFSALNSEEREFLLTGSTTKEWDALFKEESNVEEANACV